MDEGGENCRRLRLWQSSPPVTHLFVTDEMRPTLPRHPKEKMAGMPPSTEDVAALV
jgi:hypothetical protein